MKLSELLDNPDHIAKLSDTELNALLSPYFPKVRTPLLPPETSRKQGVEFAMAKTLLEANKEMIEQLRKARSK